MATNELSYGASGQPITITLASLASSLTAGRASTAVSNTTTLSFDALVTVKIKMPAAGTPANDKAVYVYAYASSDGGTTYSDNITGTDAAFTHTDPPNLQLVGVINAPANTLTYTGGPFSVAAAFGGLLPEKWGIFIRNYTGLALDTTGSSCFFQLIEGIST